MRKIIGLLTPALIILAGVLVVKFREEMVTWLTIGLGALFFMAGVISCISYYIQRKHVLKMRSMIADGASVLDAEGNEPDGRQNLFKKSRFCSRVSCLSKRTELFIGHGSVPSFHPVLSCTLYRNPSEILLKRT